MSECNHVNLFDLAADKYWHECLFCKIESLEARVRELEEGCEIHLSFAKEMRADRDKGEVFWRKEMDKLKTAHSKGYAQGREEGYAQAIADSAEVAEKHEVSIHDHTGNEWDEWGYDVDIAAAIRKLCNNDKLGGE